MKIRYILSVFVLIAATFLVGVSTTSAQVSNGSDDVSASVTATNGADDLPPAVTVTVPPQPEVVGNVYNGGDEGETAVPTNNGTSNVEVTISNGDDEAAAQAPSNPGSTNTNTNTSTDTNSGSNGGSSSGSKRRSSTSSSSAPAPVATSTCPVITSELLKIGGTNDSADVSRLQSFLKNVEKINVEVTGTFDAQTEAAVKAFQVKYAHDILAPWKATKASGVVYITTKKKINEIGCGIVSAVSAAERAIIDSYNTKVPTGSAVIGSTTGTSSNGVAVVTNLGATSTSATSTDVEANVAAGAEAPVLKRFWGFVVDLFR